MDREAARQDAMQVGMLWDFACSERLRGTLCFVFLFLMLSSSIDTITALRIKLFSFFIALFINANLILNFFMVLQFT